MNLPKGWVESTLGEVVSLAQGVAINKKTNHVLSDKENGLPLLKINNLLNNTVDQYANPNLVPKQAILEKSDVIFTRTGQVGWVFTNKVGILHNNSFKIIPTDKVNKKFLYRFLKQTSIYRYVQKVASGSAQPDLNHDAFKTITIKYPVNLEEQKAIASILSSFDEKIELLKAQNETLEQMAQGVFREWFVDGVDTSQNKVKLSEYVETNISTIKKDTTLSVIQYLDTASLTKGMISNYQVLNVEDAPSRAKREVKHLDILISTVRPDQNHYGIIRNPDKNIIVSTGYCVVTCHKINPYFVYLFLTTKQMTEYLHNIAEGSTSTYPSIKPIDIENIEFYLPSKERLDAFFDLADSIWEKLDYNYSQIQTLQKTRDTLLPKLMSGELRVKGVSDA